MLVGRPLMIGIDIRALLLDVRFASSPSQKWAAANCTGSAYCIPAIFDISAIGFRFPNVTCHKILHKDAPYWCLKERSQWVPAR
jgi:hypothetical protein